MSVDSEQLLSKRQEPALPDVDPCIPNFAGANIAWVMASTALVLFMVPGLGYFYSGMARTKNALSMLYVVMISLVVVSIQWFLFGYSLAFSPSGNNFIGNFSHGVLSGVGNNVYACEEGGQTSIPENLFMMFQGTFAAITPALAFGAIAGRARILPLFLFIFLWTTIVYDPITYWTWAPTGWLHKIGSLDAAGGTPVHVTSGAAALALSLVVGKRQGLSTESFRPHNMSNVFLGTAILWFGWIGFNAGSIFEANARAVNSVIVSNLSACMGALTWIVLDYLKEPPKHRKWSAMGLCAGAVCGLVSITPASGYVSPASSLAFGFSAGVGCWLVTTYKRKVLKPFDDALDVFAVHGTGGIIGNFLTGVFAEAAIVELDGSTGVEPLGWLDGNFGRVLPQMAGGAAAFAWSFCITLIIALIMNRTPMLRFRVKDEQEKLGVDVGQLGETAYEFANTMSETSSVTSARSPRPKDDASSSQRRPTAEAANDDQPISPTPKAV